MHSRDNARSRRLRGSGFVEEGRLRGTAVVRHHRMGMLRHECGLLGCHMSGGQLNQLRQNPQLQQPQPQWAPNVVSNPESERVYAGQMTAITHRADRPAADATATARDYPHGSPEGLWSSAAVGQRSQDLIASRQAPNG
jgi:hypothetical protein